MTRRGWHLWAVCLALLALLPMRSAVHAATGVPITLQGPAILALPSPHHVNVGDLDGDGHLDLLAYSEGNACVFYGHGDGAFDSVLKYNVGPNDDTEWANVMAADVNGDGRLDLCCAVGSAQAAVIRLNQGGRIFGPAASYHTDSRARGIVAADFNEDGHLDLAVSNHYGHNLSILLNNGDGTFAPEVLYAGTGWPGGLVTADFNGDGHVDIAMTQYISDSVLIFLGDGAGAFQRVGEYNVGSYPAAIVTADFNGDGKMDLVTSNTFEQNISVLFGDGTGKFGGGTSYGTGLYPHWGAAADMDGDGDMDLVLPYYGDNVVGVMENNGSAVFSGPSGFPTNGDSPHHLTVGDFNEDGRPDVAAANDNSSNISLFFNTTPFPHDPAFSNLVSRFPGDGNATDVMGGNDGAPNSGAGFAPGLFGQAFSLDGVDDGFNVPDGANLHFTDSLSMTGWVFVKSFPVSANNGGIIFFRGDDRGGFDPYHLAVEHDGTAYFQICASPSIASLAHPISSGRWVHVAATLEGLTGEMRIYLDGQLQQSVKTPLRPFRDLIPSQHPSCGIGNVGNRPAQPYNAPFHGLIDDVQLYGRCLTPAEIRLAASGGASILVAPSALSASFVSSTSLKLAWVDVSGNESGFKIERKPSGGTFSQIAVTAANVSSFVDTGLTPDTVYIYRVRATNSDGDSAYSNEASAKTTVPPAAPSALTAKAVSDSRIDLTWVDNSGSEIRFELERRTGGGAYSRIASPVPNTTSYSDQVLRASTLYTYRIRAVSLDAESFYSNEVTAKTQELSAPTGPTDCTAQAVSTEDVLISWGDNSADEGGFQIERRTGAGSFAPIATVAANVTTFNDLDVLPDQSYTYRLHSYGTGGLSPASNDSATTTVREPSDFAAAALSSTQAKLTWKDRSARETGYVVERKAGLGKYVEIGRLPANSTAYVDGAISGNVIYRYRVRAFNPTAFSSFTPALEVTTLAAPTGLKAAAQSPSSIRLDWTDASTGETEFQVERRGVGGSYARVAIVGAGVHTYLDTGLTANSDFTYRVRAANSEGVSSYSNEAESNTPNPIPAVPTGLKVTAFSTSDLQLSWTDSATNEDGFKIERKYGIYGFQELIVVSANKTGYTDSGLQTNVTYTYRVRAYNSGGDSAYSNEASGSPLPTIPSAPTDLSATVKSQTRVDLAWTDRSNNEGGFKIERSVSGGGYTLLTTTAANAPGYSDTSVKANTVLFYRVRATNRGGDSAPSNTVQVKTLPDLPGAPTNLKATAVSETRIDLSWTQGGGGDEQGFEIQRKSGGSGYAGIATPAANVTTYSDTGLTPNTAYTYRVRAQNAAGVSTFSNESSATTGTALGGILDVVKSLAFGKVKAKTTVVKSLVIRNRSTTQGLQVTLTPPAAPYAITANGAPTIIAPGGQATVRISFKPLKKKKSYTGSLKIASSDPGHRSAAVKLTGAGK